MGVLEDTPLSSRDGERVRKRLKDDGAFILAIAVPARRRECERMRRVVGEIESTLDRIVRTLRVEQALVRGSD